MFSERKECDDIRKAFITDHSCYHVENEAERIETGKPVRKTWQLSRELMTGAAIQRAAAG